MLSNDELVQRCIAARRARNAPLAVGDGEINTDYIEGMDMDGTVNANRKNAFDDLHVVYTFKHGVPVFLMKAEATTQPGSRYTLRPINPEGAAIADLGYQECWQPGLHRGNYPALIQTGGSIRVWRDRSKSYARGGENKLTSGWFGINQHHGSDADRSDIGSHSAGCLVTRLVAEHQKALSFKKQDPRYVANRNFIFGACIMPAAWITGVGDQDARPRPDIQPDAPKGTFTGLGGLVTALSTTGTYMTEHWGYFAFAVAVIVVGTVIFYWREPYPVRPEDIRHD